MELGLLVDTVMLGIVVFYIAKARADSEDSKKAMQRIEQRQQIFDPVVKLLGEVMPEMLEETKRTRQGIEKASKGRDELISEGKTLFQDEKDR